MDMCLVLRGLYVLFYHSFETPVCGYIRSLVGFLLSCGYSHTQLVYWFWGAYLCLESCLFAQSLIFGCMFW
jgi:hypothetical protein